MNKEIHFKIDSDIIELAENRAEQRELNLTEYIQYLVKKDVNKTVYVYWSNKIPEQFDSNILQRLSDCGLGVLMNNEYLLSRNETITIDNIEIISYITLEEYIEGLGHFGRINISNTFSVDEDEVLELFTSKLYQPISKNTYETYAESIYNAKDPYKKIIDYTSEFLNDIIDLNLDTIRKNSENIKRLIKDGKFNW